MLILLKIMACWLLIATAFGLLFGRVCRLGKPTGKYDGLLEEVIRADRKCQLDATITGNMYTFRTHERP